MRGQAKCFCETLTPEQRVILQKVCSEHDELRSWAASIPTASPSHERSRAYTLRNTAPNDDCHPLCELEQHLPGRMPGLEYTCPRSSFTPSTDHIVNTSESCSDEHYVAGTMTTENDYGHQISLRRSSRSFSQQSKEINAWLGWYESSQNRSILENMSEEWNRKPSAFFEVIASTNSTNSEDALLSIYMSCTMNGAHPQMIKWITAMLYRVRVFRTHSNRSVTQRRMIKYGKAAQEYIQLFGNHFSAALLLTQPSWSNLRVEEKKRACVSLLTRTDLKSQLKKHEDLARRIILHIWRVTTGDPDASFPSFPEDSESTTLSSILDGHRGASSLSETSGFHSTSRKLHPISSAPSDGNTTQMSPPETMDTRSGLQTTCSSTCGELASDVPTIEATFVYENGEGFHRHGLIEVVCNVDGPSIALPPEHMLHAFETDMERSHTLTRSEASTKVSYNEKEEASQPNLMITTGDVAQCRANEDILSFMFPLSGTMKERTAASESGEELLLSASQTASAPTTLLLRGARADSGLDDGVDPSRVSYSPSPSLAFSVPENLYRHIAVYFEECCGKMVFDKNGILLCQNGAELRNDLCTEFDSYCFTATMLEEKGLYVELRGALSRASALVDPILRAEHPRTLACFLEVLIHLLQTGLSEVAVLLRSFIKEMSVKTSGKEGIWSRIFQLLDETDLKCLAHVMTQGWRCTTDVFDRVLGSSHRLAVSVRLDYIKRVMIADHSNEERVLRDLLSRMASPPVHSTPRVMLNLAHNLNRQGCHDEAEKVAREVLFMLQQYGMYAGRVAESIESLKVLSRSQFIQGRTLDAERTMREAIQAIVDQWGQQHPWALEFTNVLEGWLRAWDRGEDANVLRGRMKDVIAE